MYTKTKTWTKNTKKKRKTENQDSKKEGGKVAHEVRVRVRWRFLYEPADYYCCYY